MNIILTVWFGFSVDSLVAVSEILKKKNKVNKSKKSN